MHLEIGHPVSVGEVRHIYTYVGQRLCADNSAFFNVRSLSKQERRISRYICIVQLQMVLLILDFNVFMCV